MELNELQKNRLLKDSGFPVNDSLLKKDNINELRLLKDSGFSTSDGTNLIGNTKDRKDLEDANRNFFQNILGNVSEWAVGDDADWGTYWERGLGKSLSLIHI